MTTFFNGKKTYISAIIAMGVTLGSWYLGTIDSQTAVSSIWVALQTIFIRHGIETSQG